MRAVLACAAVLGCAPPTASAPQGPAAATHGAATPSPASSSAKAATDEPHVPALPIPSCSDVGPRACGGAPSPAASFCPAVAECARKFPIDALGPLPSVDCDKLADETPAPPGSGLEGTAIVALHGQETEMHGWQATALLARYPNGICVVDSVFDWAPLRGNWFVVDLDYKWSKAADGGFRLELAGRQSAEFPLDRQQPAEDAPNVSYVLCKRAVYSVTNGHFRRVHEEQDLCPTELDSR
jgi:hypothetical protein